jgi:hypothetical protein
MSQALIVVWILLKPVSLFLVYLAFLYEDEEGRIQDHIQDRMGDIWIRLDDARASSLSWVAAFMKGTAKLGIWIIDSIFGAKPVSFRLLGTSYCLSLASVNMFLFFTPQPRVQWPYLTTPLHPMHLLLAFCFLYIGLTPALFSNRWVISLWYCCLLWSTVGFLDFVHYLSSKGNPQLAFGMLGFAGTWFCMSFLCDVLWIFFARWVLRRVLFALGSAQVYWTVLAACILLAIMLAALPAVIGLGFLTLGEGLHILSTGLLFAGVAMIFTFVLNGVSLLTCFAALLFACLMLLNRFLWPLLQRPLYLLQRYGFIKNKKALWGTGIALLLLPQPQTMLALSRWLLDRIPNLF